MAVVRGQPVRGARPLVVPPRGSALRRLLERECFVLVALSATLAAVAAAAPASMIVPDTWLSLVDGRWIVQHGLPHSDRLAVWTAGSHWVDQQWLAQVALYEVARAGGIRLYVAVALALDALALICAAFAARRMGASPRSVAIALLVPVVAGPWLLQARTQSLAIPLFVGVYALIAADARKPSRRTFAVVPLLVLWANLHGSAVVGASLVLAHGVVEVVERRLRGVVLALAAPATLLVSPYGGELAGYYHRMLLGSPLRHYVQEWMPTRVDVGTASFFVISLVSAYLVGRSANAVSLFERLALPLLIVLGLTAVRNTIWLGLGFAITGPALIDSTVRSPAPLTRTLRRLNGYLSSFAIACAAVVLAVTLSRPAASLLHGWPDEGAAAVSAAAGRNGLVLADDVHSDWLLWKEPQLIGRIAYDVRFELFSRSQFSILQAIREGRAPAKASAFRVFTFGTGNASAPAVPQGRIVYGSPRFAVVER